jgi:pimeloyl-ACP methyl ester carboxylesterase
MRAWRRILRTASLVIARAHGDRRVLAANNHSAAPSRRVIEKPSITSASRKAYLIEALDLKNITLVVQDWGGPIGSASRCGIPTHAHISETTALSPPSFRDAPKGAGPESITTAWGGYGFLYLTGRHCHSGDGWR